MFKAWRDLRLLPADIWILCVAMLVNRAGTMVLPFLVLYASRDLGFSAVHAGGLLALYGAVALVVGPIAGRLSDRWGRLPIMEGSLVTSGLLLLIYPFARTWGTIIPMTIAWAVATEMFRPANLSLFSELTTPAQRKPAFALSRLAINLGMSIGPAIGGFLAQHSFRSMFFVDGLTTLAAAAILILSPFHARTRALDAARPPRDKSEASVFPLAPLLTDPVLRVSMLGLLPVLIVFFQHESALSIYLVRDLGFPESIYGFLFTINTVLIVALEIPLNAAMAHWPYRRSFAVGSLLMALGFGAYAFASAASVWAIVAATAIWTFGEMVLFPSVSAYMSEIAPPARRGEYMGLYTMTFSVAFMLGPWLGTWGLEHFGARPLWGAAFLFGLVSMLVFRRLSEPKAAV